MTILVTRPEPGASRTVAALEARGLVALSCPLFNVVASGSARPSGKFAALLVTSGHGADGLTPAVADLPATLPVFAVGDRTAEAMAANGFSNVTSASGDQKALTRLVLAKLPPRYRVLLATGEDHKDGLPAAFAEAGHEIALWIRYRAEAVTELPEAARAAIAAGSIKKVLHYSRRASETFVALAAAAGFEPKAAQIEHLALSADVAEPLRAAGFAHVTVAAHPDEDHMLALVTGDDVLLAEPITGTTDAGIAAPAMTRTTPRARKSAVLVTEVAKASADEKPAPPASPDVKTPADSTESDPDLSKLHKIASPIMPDIPDGMAGQTTPQVASPAVIQRGFGFRTILATALASGLIGAGLIGYVAPRLGLNMPAPSAVADISARLAKLEASSAPQAMPDMQAAIQTALQSAPVAPQLRDQIGGLERRLAELAARPLATSTTPDNALITELRGKLAEAERATQALGSRLAEVEKAARSVGAPSASATAAAKLIVADRLSRALAEGRPFADEMSALTALDSATEPMRVLGPMAAAGAPAMTAITAEFRKLRPVFAAEPASADAPWSERLLKLTDGLVRVRSTGAVQGTSPAAVASRIDQALQRGDAGAAAAAFNDLPEPARRAGEAWIATVRQRASADQAVKSITDDAIKALSAEK